MTHVSDGAGDALPIPPILGLEEVQATIEVPGEVEACLVDLEAGGIAQQRFNRCVNFTIAAGALLLAEVVMDAAQQHVPSTLSEGAMYFGTVAALVGGFLRGNKIKRTYEASL